MSDWTDFFGVTSPNGGLASADRNLQKLTPESKTAPSLQHIVERQKIAIAGGIPIAPSDHSSIYNAASGLGIANLDVTGSGLDVALQARKAVSLSGKLSIILHSSSCSLKRNNNTCETGCCQCDTSPTLKCRLQHSVFTANTFSANSAFSWGPNIQRFDTRSKYGKLFNELRSFRGQIESAHYW